MYSWLPCRRRQGYATQRSAHRACATVPARSSRLPCIVGCRAGGNPWLGPVPLPLAVTMATLEASASAPPLDSLESMPSSQPRFLSSVYLGHQCPESPAGAVASILSTLCAWCLVIFVFPSKRGCAVCHPRGERAPRGTIARELARPAECACAIRRQLREASIRRAGAEPFFPQAPLVAPDGYARPPVPHTLASSGGASPGF